MEAHFRGLRVSRGPSQGKGEGPRAQADVMVEEEAGSGHLLLLRQEVSPQRADHGPSGPTGQGGQEYEEQLCCLVQGVQYQEEDLTPLGMGRVPKRSQARRIRPSLTAHVTFSIHPCGSGLVPYWIPWSSS